MNPESQNQQADEAKWFFVVDGETKGPLTLNQTLELAAQGTIDLSSLAWCEGMADWQALGEIPELVKATAPLPVSMEHQNDIFKKIEPYWPLLLGCVVILVLFLGGIMFASPSNVRIRTNEPARAPNARIYTNKAASAPNTRIHSNESAALRNLRELICGESKYITSNRTYTGKLADLTGGPEPILNGKWDVTKQGYDFTLTTNSDGSNFEVVALPHTSEDGKRGFFADASGVIRFSEDGLKRKPDKSSPSCQDQGWE